MNPHNTLRSPRVNTHRDSPARERGNAEEEAESRPEYTREQALKAAAEDFSAAVEAEGEAALREAILDDLEIEDWEEQAPPLHADGDRHEGRTAEDRAVPRPPPSPRRKVASH